MVFDKMSGWFKDILFVSYLKNKGVRRLCFIIGLFFGIIAICVWLDYAENNFYDISFNSMEEVEKTEPNDEKLRRIFNKYPVNFGKNLGDFDNWKSFFFESWTGDYKTRKSFLEDYKMKNFNKKNESFELLEKYVQQKIFINRANYLFLLNFLYVIGVFYFPFWLCCVIKWVRDGFKESKNC